MKEGKRNGDDRPNNGKENDNSYANAKTEKVEKAAVAGVTDGHLVGALLTKIRCGSVKIVVGSVFVHIFCVCVCVCVHYLPLQYTS